MKHRDRKNLNAGPGAHAREEKISPEISTNRPVNIREQLISELSRKNIDYIIHCLGADENGFAEIIRLILHDRDPVPSRAAWVAEGISGRYPWMAEKYIPDLVDALPVFTHSGTRRNILKMLSRYVIPADRQGPLVDLCFGWLLSDEEPVAVKVYAMQIIANHLDEYPELRNELKEVIEDRLDRNSAGFRARGKKILARISRMG